jgi:hypothetical protein
MQPVVDRARPADSDSRIDQLYSADRGWAFAAVVALLALYAFVLYQIHPFIEDQNALLALLISGGLVFIFNAASIIAMISHFSEEKEQIYGLDLHYLDIRRKRGR